MSRFVSRRRFVALSALGAARALLAACDQAPPPAPTAAPAAKPAAAVPPSGNPEPTKPAAQGAAQSATSAPAGNAPAGKDAVQIVILQRNIPQDVKHMEDMAK